MYLEPHLRTLLELEPDEPIAPAVAELLQERTALQYKLRDALDEIEILRRELRWAAQELQDARQAHKLDLEDPVPF